MIKKVVSIAIAATLIAGSIFNYGGAFAAPKTLTGTLKCSGSTALLPIIKTAADDFMKANPKVSVQVAGGGSGTGVQQVFDGVVNIGESDVPADSSKYPGLVGYEVAIIPFAFIVNPSVNVTNLTKAQLTDILSGKITNWKEVGGNDQKIQVVTRQESSGSRKTIQTVVLDNKPIFTKNAIVQESNGGVKSTVINTPGAIGFVDLAYVNASIKTLSYNGVAPTLANIIAKKYDIASVGRMYTKGNATGLTKAFIDYIRGSVFQNRTLPMYKFGKVSDIAQKTTTKIVKKANTKVIKKKNFKK